MIKLLIFLSVGLNKSKAEKLEKELIDLNEASKKVILEARAQVEEL
jgi:hypothetical protein